MNNDIVKKGADFLLKGGTLLSEPCKICNGLLIKYKGDIVCLNCQRSTLKQDKLKNVPDKIFGENEKEEIRQEPFDKDNKNSIYDSEGKINYKDLLLQIDKTITKKIIDTNKLIHIEEDAIKQENNLKTLYLYLKILDRIKKR